MHKCIAIFALIIASLAQGASNAPIVWFGNYSSDMSVLGLMTNGITVRVGGSLRFNNFGRGQLETDASGNVGVTNLFTTSVEVTGNCTASPCTINKNFGSSVSSITRSSTGIYDVNFTGSFWSTGPICQVVSTRGTVGHTCITNGTASTSSLNIRCYMSDTIAALDSSFSLVCQGPR